MERAGRDDHAAHALHRARQLEQPLRTSLIDLSSEQAATALVDRFAVTGYAEAQVAEPDRVRALVRRDCRHRRLTVRTWAVHNVVLIVDAQRHQQWLRSPDGQAYRAAADAVMLRAVSDQLPAPTGGPPRRRGSLRSVPPA